jgi:CheY-like chemotaxis protein
MDKESKRVLVVEDDKDWQEMARHKLTAQGYEVGVVGTVQEAKEEIDSKFYHVAVVDLRLDEQTPEARGGMDVLKHIWELDEGTRAIVWSGFTGEMPLVKLFLEYKIVNVADKNPEFVKEFDKGDAAAKLTEAVSNAFHEAERDAQLVESRAIWEGSPFSFMNGVLARDIQLAVGGGTMSELRGFLGELRSFYAPWLQAKDVKPVPISVDGKCIGFQAPCWSRKLGEALLVRFGRSDLFERGLSSNPIDDKSLPFGSLGEKAYPAPEYQHYTGVVYKLKNAEFAKNFKRPKPRKTPEH